MIFAPLTRKLTRYRSLETASRRAFRQALVAIPWRHLQLRLVGYAPLARRLGLDRPPTQLRPRVDAGALERGFSLALRYAPHRGSCLSRAMTLCQLLRRGGHDAIVKVGVRSGSDTIEAHAWVELHGQALAVDGGTRDRYTCLGAVTG